MADKELKLCMGCMAPLTEEGPCGVCGYDPDVPPDLEFLPPGSVLGGRYLVGKLVDSDPEGAWYVGFDRAERLRVWVREYAPGCISRRDHEDFSIRPLTSSEAQYKALMADFEDLCASIRSLPPGEKVLPLVDVLHANNTAYAVYRYIKTISLDSFLKRSGGRLSWRHTKKLLMPLFHTMVNVHKAGLIHRGLSPQTIHLDQSGALWVTSFSIAAARTDKSELSARLFCGYAAPEQYSLNSWQGIWSDVYALGGITYRALTGQDPPGALDRVYGDDLLDPGGKLGAELTEPVVRAVNRALAVEVEDRTQSVEAYISDLLTTVGSDTAVYTAMPRRPSFEDAEALEGGRRAHVGDEEFEDGAGLTPVPGAASPGGAQERAPKKKRERRGRRGEKRAHPVLSLFLSAVAATALLGLAVYWFSNTYLADLLAPAGAGAASGSSASSGIGGIAYSEAEDADQNLVPKFVGATRQSIEGNGELADRFIFLYEEKFNGDYDEGVVYDQSPLEGSELPADRIVTLYVSKGPEKIPLPNLAGVPLEDAIRQLESLELRYQVIPRYNRAAEPDVVLGTDPAEPGALLDKERDQVVLYIKMVDASGEEESSDEEDDRGGSSKSASSKKSSKSSGSSSRRLRPNENSKVGYYDDEGNWVEIIINNRDD